MNTDKTYAEKIASEYAPKEARKVVALKKLDSRAKAPARIFAYTSVCAALKRIWLIFLSPSESPQRAICAATMI